VFTEPVKITSITNFFPEPPPALPGLALQRISLADGIGTESKQALGAPIVHSGGDISAVENCRVDAAVPDEPAVIGRN